MQEEFPYQDFTKLELGGTYEFEITRGDSHRITVEADDKLFRNLRVEKKGDTLRLTKSPHIGWRWRFDRPEVRIQMPRLTDIRLFGTAGGSLSGFGDTEEPLIIDMDGASHLSANITVKDVNVRLRGACHFNAEGAVERLVIDANGACHIHLEKYRAQDAAIRLNGVTNGVVNVNGRLDARLNGMSTLHWLGEPKMGDIRVLGMSSISRWEK